MWSTSRLSKIIKVTSKQFKLLFYTNEKTELSLKITCC